MEWIHLEEYNPTGLQKEVKRIYIVQNGIVKMDIYIKEMKICVKRMVSIIKNNSKSKKKNRKITSTNVFKNRK